VKLKHINGKVDFPGGFLRICINTFPETLVDDDCLPLSRQGQMITQEAIMEKFP